MIKLIKNGRVAYNNGFSDKLIIIRDGVIEDIAERAEIPDDAEIFDAAGLTVLPAFVDTHLHGGGGYDFLDCTEEAFENIFKTHLSHGTLKICPTLVSCSADRMFKFFDAVKPYADDGRFLGLHLEGPFLSQEMCGAQPPGVIVNPTKEFCDEILRRGGGMISRITCAPELPGTEYLAETFLKHGIGLSIGHSAAYAPEVWKAFSLGFNQTTHLFCSSTFRVKRGSYVYGGIAECALLNDDCYVELIGDGHHISREIFELAIKVKGYEKVCIVSDAMRAAGEDTEESYLGEILPQNRVIVEDGVAKIPDRSFFAGSVATGDNMYRILTDKYGLDEYGVSVMMSLSPSKMLGITDGGKIEKGFRADFTMLDENKNTAAVFQSGKEIKISGADRL